MKRLIFALSLAAFAPAFTPGLATADQAAISRGAKVFKKCVACHKVGDAARHRTGPHLNGLFGRTAGTADGYRFSKAMRRMGADGLSWDHEKLDLFIENPKTLVSGTKMKFRGIDDPGARADLIAYLRVFSDDPSDIPESAPTETPSDPALDAAILALQGDPDYGEYLSSECVTCHRADGDDAGIPSITGWAVEDFVTALHAYRSKHRENPAMRLVASRLSDEEIAGLAAYFAAVTD